MNLNYISVPPGTGKTTAALAYIADHVRRGMAEEVGYVFYVAPTVNLLRQSYTNLTKLLPSHEMLFMATSGGKTGRTVADKIAGILNGSDQYAMPFLPGSVLFLTHTAFLGLRDNAKFADTTVFFDESRKWVDSPKRVDLANGGKEAFEDLFDRMPIGDGQISEMIPRIPTAPARLRISDLEALHKIATQGRAKCFCTQIGTHTSRPQLVTLTLPSQPFAGFKEVYVMSADFETSQMYHLFRHEGYEPINRTATFMDKWLPGGFMAAQVAIERRYSALTLVPLLDTKAMPSKYQAQYGVAVPVDSLTQFKERMEAAHIGTARLRDLVAYKRDPIAFNTLVKPLEQKFLKQMDEMQCNLDLIGWLLASTEGVAQNWWSANSLPESGLLILNEDAGRLENLSGFDTLGLGMVEGRNDFQDCTVVAFHAAVNPDPVISRMLNMLLESTGYDSDEDYVTDKAIQSIGRGIIRNRGVDTTMLAIVPTVGLAERIKARMGYYPILDTKPLKELGSFTYWTYNRAVSIEAAEDGLSVKHRYLAKPINKEIQCAQVNRSKARSKLKDAATDERRAKAQADIDKWQSILDELIARRDSVLNAAA
ncbi:DEAD/DEAH box helicase family protein [Burkholderia cepacia]|uniref:DEAD/DEAH box helicase family protein n=1 Tax=Burkholderia cepacia TaxID=292 RepID=UPI002ABD4ECF|nr:DEAD/DEAH box helicase family protein [Burkholderia cepacia]